MEVNKLYKLLELDETSGNLYWKVDRNGGSKTGDLAGSLNTKGYLCIKIDGRTYKAHRIILAMINGYWPEEEVDHINGVKGDNRPCNLREATGAQNRHNIGAYKNNVSGVKGVRWNKQRGQYRAVIMIDKKNKHLGYYDDIELAELVHQEAARIYRGQYAHGIAG